MLFQIIFTLFIILAVSASLQTGKRHAMSTRGLVAWALLWLCALGIVWTPTATDYIALQLGIGRGVDVVLYSTIPVLFFLLFRLHIKLATIESQITKIVREHALRSVQK